MRTALTLAGAAPWLALVAAVSCSVKEPTKSSYFDQTIAPILTTGCVRTNTGAGCHVADAKGNALGNLDLSTFAGVDERRDLLADYGPYGQPTLLVKNVPPFALNVRAYDGTSVGITTDLRHAGGSVLDPTASAFLVLRRWIEAGATEDNAGAPPKGGARLPCTSDVPPSPGFDPAHDPPGADFGTFRDRVAPVLRASCAAGDCHGSAGNDLRFTCGDTPEGLRWNYFAAQDYLASKPEESEMVRRPLAPQAGGSFHEGGVVFAAASDDGYQALLAWAKEHGPPTAPASNAGFDFFAHRVQPVLVKKGCMLLHCHSASMFHDYRLSGGAGASFSLGATKRNYALSRAQLALETEDPNASRLVRKNLYRPEVFDGGQGIAHRGGALFEDFAGPARASSCDGHGYDYDQGKLDAIPAYCVVREWLRRERDALPLAPLSAIVYVRRPIATTPDRVQDFDVYAPGADLRRADATLDAAGHAVLGADRSLTAGCGLDPATADVRRPQVSWDGAQVAFAARASADAPLRIYVMAADGSSCRPHDGLAAPKTNDNGLLVHDFDPVFSPPDASGAVRIVFASTRGNLDTAPYDYQGAQRTPADPTKPNANLYVWEPDPNAPGASRVRQLTYLLDMERAPAFMQDGRLMMTTEKRAPGFYQLALRRQNLDGGDYHPLYGQRASIGYHEVSQVVQLADKDFAAVFADRGVPHHGGALGIVNRTIGVDFGSADPKDYPMDAAVMDPSAPQSPDPRFFLHSLRFPDARVSGHLHAQTEGVYASPSPLPGGDVLVSFGAAADAATFDGDYDLAVVDVSTGARTRLLGDPGVAEVDAVAVYARTPRGVYRSAADQPNAYAMTEGEPAAEVTMHDAQAIASLMFQNTPTGRPVENDLTSIAVYEDLPPPPDVTTFAQGGAFVTADEFGQLYVRRRKLGDVPIASDGSAHFLVPGGVPFVLELGPTAASSASGRPRVQREEMMLTPGEHVHEAFPRERFDGFCGQCHGAISGRPVDVAFRPDVLAGASSTLAHDAPPTNLALPPSARGVVFGP